MITHNLTLYQTTLPITQYLIRLCFSALLLWLQLGWALAPEGSSSRNTKPDSDDHFLILTSATDSSYIKTNCCESNWPNKVVMVAGDRGMPLGNTEAKGSASSCWQCFISGEDWAQPCLNNFGTSLNEWSYSQKSIAPKWAICHFPHIFLNIVAHPNLTKSTAISTSSPP